MRLLKHDEDGKLGLVVYVPRDVPQYAIPSHTWGSDRDEVTYKDFIQDRGEKKMGYKKLSFCGKQAVGDGVQHFLVDTRFIDNVGWIRKPFVSGGGCRQKRWAFWGTFRK
jgi:hypothetical protein